MAFGATYFLAGDDDSPGVTVGAGDVDVVGVSEGSGDGGALFLRCGEALGEDVGKAFFFFAVGDSDFSSADGVLFFGEDVTDGIGDSSARTDFFDGAGDGLVVADFDVHYLVRQKPLVNHSHDTVAHCEGKHL